MRLLLALLFLAAPAAAAPRLLVVVSVDQMRADYLERYAGDFKGGFKTLREKAAWFTNARHDHVPTETGPGHAAILTGRRPADTGIVANEWYDRRLSTVVYCVWDSVHGRGPEHLLSYTLGDALKAKDPLSRVVSVSGKDRAAILMGGKRADLALWFEAADGRFETSSYYARPAWLADFNSRLAIKDPKEFAYSSELDLGTLKAAERALAEYSLGADDHPDVLAISFSATDRIGHRYGPFTPQMRAQLLALDAMLGELMAELDRRVGAGRWELALTADHGATPLPESSEGKTKHLRRVRYEDIDAAFDKALKTAFGGELPRIRSLFPLVYLDRADAKRFGLDWAGLKARVARALEKAEYVAKVYVDDQPDAADPLAAVVERSVRPGVSGDLLVRLREDVALSEGPTGANHGSFTDDDSRVPLLLLGPDFKPGKIAARATVADLAPTLGRVLGVPFPPADESSVRVDALRQPALP